MVAHYEQVSGRETHDLRYYEVLGGPASSRSSWRGSPALLVEFEILPADNDMAVNNIPSRLTAALLGLPSPGEPVPVIT